VWVVEEKEEEEGEDIIINTPVFVYMCAWSEFGFSV
jgi:hypothetical protein